MASFEEKNAAAEAAAAAADDRDAAEYLEGLAKDPDGTSSNGSSSPFRRTTRSRSKSTPPPPPSALRATTTTPPAFRPRTAPDSSSKKQPAQKHVAFDDDASTLSTLESAKQVAVEEIDALVAPPDPSAIKVIAVDLENADNNGRFSVLFTPIGKRKQGEEQVVQQRVCHVHDYGAAECDLKLYKATIGTREELEKLNLPDGMTVLGLENRCVIYEVPIGAFMHNPNQQEFSKGKEVFCMDLYSEHQAQVTKLNKVRKTHIFLLIWRGDWRLVTTSNDIKDTKIAVGMHNFYLDDKKTQPGHPKTNVVSFEVRDIQRKQVKDKTVAPVITEAATLKLSDMKIL